MPVTEQIQKWADDLVANGVDKSAVDALLKELEAKGTAAEFIKGSQLRQQDYDRNLNRLKEEQEQKLLAIQQQEKTLTDAIAEWKASNAEWKLSKSAYDTEEKRMKEVLASLSNDKGDGGNGGRPTENLEDLDEPVKKLHQQVASLQDQLKGSVTKDEIARLREEITGELTTMFRKEGLPQAISAAVSESELSMRHQQEFGEPLNREDLMKYVKQSGVTFPTISKAYEFYVHDRRLEKSSTDKAKKEVESAAQRAREDERAKLMQARATVPGTTPSGTNGWNDKSRQLDPETAKKLDGVKLGHNNSQLVAAMANDLMKQGKTIFTTGLEGIVSPSQ